MITAAQLRLCGYAAVALAFLSVLTFAGCERRNANQARAERDVARQARDLAKAANTTNLETIEIQDAALDRWMKLGVTPDQVAGMLDQMKRFKTRADELAAENNMLRNKDRALPECVALLRMSLSDRCPAIAAGVLDAARRNENSPGQDPDPRVPGAPD